MYKFSHKIWTEITDVFLGRFQHVSQVSLPWYHKQRSALVNLEIPLNHHNTYWISNIILHSRGFAWVHELTSMIEWQSLTWCSHSKLLWEHISLDPMASVICGKFTGLNLSFMSSLIYKLCCVQGSGHAIKSRNDIVISCLLWWTKYRTPLCESKLLLRSYSVL